MKKQDSKSKLRASSFRVQNYFFVIFPPSLNIPFSAKSSSPPSIFTFGSQRLLISWDDVRNGKATLLVQQSAVNVKVRLIVPTLNQLLQDEIRKPQTRVFDLYGGLKLYCTSV